MNWTHKIDVEMIHWIEKGYSRRQVANILSQATNEYVTKNMVISRLRRIGYKQKTIANLK